MKIPHALAALFALALSPQILPAQEVKNADFSKGTEGWIVAFPKEIKATAEIAPDAAEGGKPALKITVGETGGAEAWKGKLVHDLVLPGPGNYTLTFMAKAEPVDASVEVSVWGSLTDREKLLGKRKGYKLNLDWQEIVYSFTVDAADPAANISWVNLAREGETFYFSNVKVTKD